MRLSLVVNEAYCRHPRMKNQQKIKVLLNGTGVVNVEQWTKM